MSQNNSVDPGSPNHPEPGSFVSRVLESDSLRKGVAAAAAGALIAVVTEALWPSRS